jgi:REP element-mobilizing transposase RayT
MELYAYIGGICNSLECDVVIVGGYIDHVHVFCKLSKKIELMKLVLKIKANSSKWIKMKGGIYREFAWQNGYAAFSVCPRQKMTLYNYISNQKDHHEKKTFKHEYLKYLKEHSLKFDERYLWD